MKPVIIPECTTGFEQPALKPKNKKTPLSAVMLAAARIDRIIAKLPDEAMRRRVINVIIAANATLPLQE